MSDRATRRPDGPPASAAGRRRTRVRVIVGLFVVAVLGSALIGWQFARESTPVSGPIVLISIDPLRADRLSFYGGRGLATPHLDRLAAGATVFTRAYAHAASSLPAHASLLTGQLPFEHGVRDDVGFRIDAGAETLATRLSGRGFTTAAAISTFLLRPQTGLNRGFTHYDAERPKAATAPLSTPAPVERGSAATAEAAVAWLDDQESARFFYALQLNGASTNPEPQPSGNPSRGLGNSEAVALGAADAAVGSVLDALRRKGWYDDALVVVTSGYGGPPDGDVNPGRGFTLADPVRRVPLVVKMPGDAEPRRVATPMQHIDVAPTVLDLVRAPGGSNLRGRSFRGVLEGDDEGPEEIPPYGEAMAGALRFGWAELVEPADGSVRSSVAGALPAVVDDADRDALARVGEVAPILLPLAASAGADRPDPRTMGAILADYRRAARRDAERRFADAIGDYQRVVEALPGDANAWHRIGLASARLGRVEAALAAFDRVEALRPGLGDGAVAAAGVEIDAGALEQAATRLETTLDAMSAAAPARTRAAAHGLLATVAAQRKRPDEARAQAALAEQALPDMPYRAFIEARLLHDMEQADQALAAFDAVAGKLDGRAVPLDGLDWYRGDALARLDRQPEAVAAFERAIAVSPFDVRGYVSLATLYHAMGRHDDAVETVDRLLVAVPTPAGWTAAARAWTAIGERELAASVRASARERFKNEPGLPR
jgi:tetratricopeptide (TPR) repeat protein